MFADYSIFTWGEDKHGQLGHGEETPWKNDPQCVVSLMDKHITQLNNRNFYFKKTINLLYSIIILYLMSIESEQGNTLVFLLVAQVS